jgi:hypothetical protein
MAQRAIVAAARQLEALRFLYHRSFRLELWMGIRSIMMDVSGFV